MSPRIRLSIGLMMTSCVLMFSGCGDSQPPAASHAANSVSSTSSPARASIETIGGASVGDLPPSISTGTSFEIRGTFVPDASADGASSPDLIARLVKVLPDGRRLIANESSAKFSPAAAGSSEFVATLDVRVKPGSYRVTLHQNGQPLAESDVLVK